MNQKQLIHGGDIYTAVCQGKKRDALLDFSANINPLGLPKGVKDAVCRALDMCHCYPDPLCRELCQAVAEQQQVPPDFFIFGNGAADLIFRLVTAKKPKKALLPAPTFAEYEQALKTAGCTVSRYMLQETEGFALKDEFLSHLAETEPEIVFLCNPNNPTGRLISPPLLRRIAEVCQERKILLVVDECFLDFLEEPEQHTVKDLAADHSCLFILRAFTKNYAMPGLRLGYGICSDKVLLDAMFEAGQPWSVSLAAQQAGLQALKEDAYLNQARTLVFRERTRLASGLEQLGYKVFAPSANYIFFRLEEREDPLYHSSLAEDLKKEGILIRSCANYEGLSAGYFRIAVKKEEENKALLAALDRREALWQKRL